MNNTKNLKIAANLLKEIARNSTDDTAFKVEDDIVANRIYLTPDEERRSFRSDKFSVFYHAEDVVDICRALGLSFWIEAQIENDKVSFEVNIY